MRGIKPGLGRARLWWAVVAALLGSMPLQQVSSRADDENGPDSCQVEALAAYRQALKMCQLAGNANPRLRCYEAAKAVYVNTLEQCRAAKGQGSY